MRQARNSPEDGDFVGTLILKAQWLRCHFGLKIRSGIWSDTLREHLFSIMQGFVTLGREVMDHPTFSRGYTVTTGIIPILFVVALQCRRTRIENDALSVLKDMRPRREGFR